MAFSQYLATKILEWYKGTTFPSALSNVYVSVHSGNPGTSGTNNDQTGAVKGTANRTSVSSANFSAVGAASGGGFEISNSTTVQITSSATNGSPIVLTHFGLWDAVTGGNFLASGTLTSSLEVQNGDTVQFNTGALVVRNV